MQVRHCFLGIDLGTSALKLILIDENRKVLAHEKITYEISQPLAGWREIDPDIWFQCLSDGLAQLFQSHDPRLVDVIGITGQMHTLVTLDVKGAALRPAIMWDDMRTGELVSEMRTEIGKWSGEDYLARTISTGSPAANLFWLQRMEPERFSRLGRFLIAPDYLVYRLTGHCVIDYCGASTSCLYNIASHDWSSPMRNLLKLDLKVYPNVRGSAVPAGKLLPEIARRFSLRDDVVVLTGTGDNAATAISSGCLGEGYPVISLGTSGVLMMRSHRLDADVKGKAILFSPDGRRFSHLMQGALQSNGTAFEWWIRSILGIDDFNSVDGMLAKHPPRRSELLFFPHLAGEKTLFADPDIRAAFLGLNPLTTREDMIGAVLEGLSFGYRQLAEAMHLDLSRCGSIRIVGGGSASEFWAQTLSNALNVEIEQMDGIVSPALGVALLAAYACGFVPSMETLANGTIKVRRRFSPEPEHTHYLAHMYPRYLRIYQALKSVYC